MSGFQGRTGVYELTATKAMAWHSSPQRRRPCRYGCRTGWQAVENHLRRDDRWQVRTGPRGRFWRVQGPGLDIGFTADLFLALSGAPEHAGDWSEDRRWLF